MSFLFGKPSSPQAVHLPASAPVPESPVAPPSPSQADTTAAAQAQVERDQAAASAVADAKAGGRSSNIVAGMRIASDAQSERGLLSSKKRAAARELGE